MRGMRDRRCLRPPHRRQRYTFQKNIPYHSPLIVIAIFTTRHKCCVITNMSPIISTKLGPSAMRATPYASSIETIFLPVIWMANLLRATLLLRWPTSSLNLLKYFYYSCYYYSFTFYLTKVFRT